LNVNNLNPDSELRKKLSELYIFIDNKNIVSIVNIFNDILNECISSSSKIFEDERSVRDLISAALIQIPSIQQVKERDTSKGRSDLELITAQTCLIIEFKRTSSTCGPEASLKKKQRSNQRKSLWIISF
ncbi:MAG: hypothetical protein IJU40_05845, partial [Desulfovibrionaceae bacterium]|nr:hypothetical protein [Desulfovibrionaceae bacterium]